MTTKKLSIKCPYKKTTGEMGYRILMYVYYDDTNQTIQKILDNTKIEKIRAVEIFADLLENSADAKDKKSLFLVTIEKESILDFDNFSSSKPKWQLAWINNDGEEEFKYIRPGNSHLHLEIQVRCPLGHENKDQIKLDFYFNDPNGAPATNLDNLRKFVSADYEDFKTPDDSKFRTLDFLLEGENRPHGTEHSSKLPSVLDFLHFAPDKEQRKPGGRSHWIIEFSKTRNISDREESKNKFGLKMSFERRKDDETGEWWGNTEEKAMMLFPLNIAPVGVGREKPDFEIFQSFSGNGSGDLVDEEKNHWIMQVHSIYDASFENNRSFTPLGAWNRLIAAQHYKSLRSVKDGTPGSVVPYFLQESYKFLDEKNMTWTIDYDVTDKTPFSNKSLEEKDFVLTLHSVKLKDEKETNPLQFEKKPSFLQIEAELRHFSDHDGNPVKRKLQLSNFSGKQSACIPVDSEDEFPKKPIFAFDVFDLAEFQDTDNSKKPIHQSRVGALDLGFAAFSQPNQPETRFKGELIAALDNLNDKNFAHYFSEKSSLVRELENRVLRNCRPQISAVMNLHLVSLSPGGQDPTPEEVADRQERTQSTVVVIEDKSMIKGAFVLVAGEQNEPQENHRLEMRLEKNKRTGQNSYITTKVNFIVLDQKPFLVARVVADINFNDEIGNWDDVESFWELSDSGRSFELVLPPQVVGEEFIKDDYEDFSPDKTLFYKFSPPAVFKLFRSTIRQNFTESPWNVRRLLGFVKGKEQGTNSEQMRFELLYGLTATVETENLRLSELSAKLGLLPELLGKNPPLFIEKLVENPPNLCDEFLIAYNDLRKNFRKDRENLQKRLALLEAWRLAAGKETFILNRKVNFQFRKGRGVVHPTDPETETFDKTFLPKEKGGLRGGVDRGFESTNIHTEVINSQSTASSLIVAPKFTALGGSGYQKAAFANDKSTIFSNTFLGRTFFYSLERIGRISTLWNTAKHVIIYERSVVDSEQFKEGFDEFGNPIPNYGDPKWRGRPVGRKLEEFIEILQPERSYPEFGEAPKVRGFVFGSRFEKQAKIRVNGKWGRDIPGGWIVPLHNLAADQRVYPPPKIDLKIATDESTGKPQTWGRIKNPEILYFYTSTDPQTNVNTDEWLAVPDVDFPLENIPTVPVKEPSHVKGALDTKLPDPPPTEGGYGRFTFQLETTGQTANLLADRMNAVTEAVIENVSMVRRSLLEFKGDKQNAVRLKITNLTDEGNAFRNQIQTEINNLIKDFENLSPTQLKEKIKKFNEEVDDKLKKINDSYQSLPLQLKEGEARTINMLRLAQAELEKNWKNAWAETRNKIKERIATIVEDPAGQWRREVQEIFDNAERQIEAAESQLNQAIRDVQRILNSVENFKAELKRLENEILARIKGAIEEVENQRQTIDFYLNAAVSEITHLQKEFQQFRNKVGNFLPDLLDRFSGFLQNLAKKLLDPNVANLPVWKAEIEQEIRNVFAQLETERNKLSKKIQDEIQKKFNDAQKILDEILDAKKRKIEELAKKPLADLKNQVEEELKKIGDEIGAEFFSPAAAEIEKLAGEIKTIYGNADALADEAKKNFQIAQKLLNEAVAKLENLQQITPQIQQSVKELILATTNEFSQALAPFERQLREEAKRIDLNAVPREIEQLRDRTLRLVRAHGLAPIAQAMQLNRDRLNYYFYEARNVLNQAGNQIEDRLLEIKNSVDFTPATVLVNRVGRELENLDLKTLGIRLPSKELAEKFVAEKFTELTNNLPKFNLREILPDFAGLNLEKLFDGVKIPEYAGENIQITHGINKQTQTAWAQCDVSFPFGKDVTFFELGPVEARLVRAHFEAHTRVTVSPFDEKKTEQQAQGAISADWNLLILGQTVLTLEKCTLRFDKGGRLKFEMQPSSVKLPSALQFLTDLVKSFSPGKKNGLSFELMTEGGLPVGVRAVLNLPIPPLQTGAFAVSHIALRARFEAAAPGGKFYVGFGMSLSSRERPFIITILFLGGGGWFDSLAIYRPFEASNKIQGKLSIGLAAGADFTFDIGVASGTVYFLVSFYAEYTFGGGSNLRLALRVAVGGEVSILGIVTVGIELSLEASYETGGTLRCSGNLTVSIEICWCFTLEVDQDVEFVLAGGGGTSGGQSLGDGSGVAAEAAAPAFDPAIENAVNAYMDSFGD